MKRICKNQEITYPALLTIENYIKNYSNKFLFRDNEKKSIVTKLINYAQKYGAIVSCAKDYSYNLTKILNDNQTTKNNLEVLKLLVESIKSGDVLSIFDIEDKLGEVKLYDEVKNLIDICNDKICINSSVSSSSNETYSKLQSDNISLKEKLNAYKADIEQLKSDIEIKDNIIESINSENESYKQKVKIFEEAINKYNSL